MNLAGTLARDLKATLTAVLFREQNRSQLNRLISVAHTLATVFLRSKITEAIRETRLHALSYSDIAFDCIADLFQQDDDGKLVQLEAYFQGIDFANSSDQELLSHLRRLVFSKVNQSLFRIYNDSDPSLGRILRNIKLAVQSLNNFDVVNRFDETCIAPSSCEALEHLPPIERDELEIELRNTTHGAETIPQMLAHLSLCLRKQHERSRLVPMISVALVFRSLYQNQLDAPAQQTTIEDQFLADDASKLIRQACLHVKNETTHKYVDTGKLSSLAFDYYFSVIEEHIIAKVINNDGQDFSFFRGLKNHLPDMTEEEYHKKHKSKIEYLARLAYERAVGLLKKHS